MNIKNAIKNWKGKEWAIVVLSVFLLGMIWNYVINPLTAQGTSNFNTIVLSDDFTVDGNTTLTGTTTMTGAVTFGGLVDLNGVADALVLDADGDTTISAPTDDQVDFEIEGVDQFVLKGVAAIDAAATTSIAEFQYTTPIDTTGTNTHDALTLDIGVGNSTGGTNTVRGLVIDVIVDDPQVVTKGIVVGDEWDYSIDSSAPALLSAQVWYQDFLGGTAPVEIVAISGSDNEAVQALVTEQFGVYQLTSGNLGTNPAADLEATHSGLIFQADQGSLVFEARMHLDGDVLTASICLGFTDDASTVEMTATISGTTITTVADDAVVFCYDTDADTDEWYAIGVAGTTDATGNAITGIAPTVDVYQVFRIEVDAGGADARFYIDGTLVGTLTANAITITDPLSCFVSVDSAGNAASHVIDIDYIYCAADRD